MAIDKMKDAFKEKGIILHVQIDDDDNIGWQDCTFFPGLNSPPSSQGFDQIKTLFFADDATGDAWKLKKHDYISCGFLLCSIDLCCEEIGLL